MNSWRCLTSTMRLLNKSPLPLAGEVAVSTAGEGESSRSPKRARASRRLTNPLPALRGRPLPEGEVKKITNRHRSTTTLLLFIVSTFTLDSAPADERFRRSAKSSEHLCKPFVAY